jgi:acyl dehydratase
MKGWNRISFVPDNSLLFALNGLQFIKPLEAGTTTLAESVLLRRAERSQCRCLRIMAAKVITSQQAFRHSSPNFWSLKAGACAFSVSIRIF